MAYRKIAMVFLSLALCLCAACAKKAPEPEPEVPPAKPAPGPKLLLEYQELSQELQCDKQKLPVLDVEANTLEPERVAPGGEVHHRLVYAFCPAPGGQAQQGVLMRKLTLKGRTVFVDQDGGRARHLRPGGGIQGGQGPARGQAPVLQRQRGSVYRLAAVTAVLSPRPCFFHGHP
jgi:hypothetical protein